MKKLKIKNWTSYIQDHNKWKLHVEKAKTFKGWSCSAWRRQRPVCFLPQVCLKALYWHSK